MLTQSLKTAFASGQFNRVPVINGSNHDEWRLFVGESELEGAPVTAENDQDMIAATLHVSAAIAAVVAGQYPLSSYSSPAVALGAVGTDAIFACPALTVDQSLSAYVPTYAYEFNDENAPELFLPPVPGFSYGAAHASELQYLFKLIEAFPATLTPPQRHLAAAMKRYWTDLASRGSPGSHAGRSSTAPASRCCRWCHRGRRSRPASPPSTTARSGLWLADPVRRAGPAPWAAGTGGRRQIRPAGGPGPGAGTWSRRSLGHPGRTAAGPA